MPASPTPTTVCNDAIPLDRGDFVDSDHEADIEAESEDTTEYFNSYFYPVRIGDIFKERYEVVHKLGRGGFSTVWLAHDQQMEEDVALKILCSAGFTAEEEAHLRVTQRVKDPTRLVLCKDAFNLHRTDGFVTYKHNVLVLPLRGPSLSTILMDIKTTGSYRMSAAKQLLQAVASIHSAGLVHRDIVLPNIVCGLSVDLGKMSSAEKYKLLGRPQKARALIQNDQVIGELVSPANFPSEILSSDIYLCDFGIMIESGTSVPNKLQSPPGYCAPELFHNFEPSFASDMWSYVVVFLHLYIEYPVFYGPGFAGKLGSIVDRVGKLPLEWKGFYNAPDKDEVQGSWYGSRPQWKDFLSGFLDQRRPDISAREKALVLSVVRQVFRLRPEERIGAAELLENEDFKALMSLYGV